MKFYELTVILNSTLDEPAIQAEIDKIEKQITTAEGKIHKFDRWGVRRLAYLIKGFHQGFYIHCVFEAPPKLIGEMVKVMRINENILRNLIVITHGFQPEEKKKAENKAASMDEPTPVEE